MIEVCEQENLCVMMMRCVEIVKTGGPAVMEIVSRSIPTIGPSDILVKSTYAGVNFIDTYHRSGVYPVPLPTILGREGAGTVVAIGDDVKRVQVGQSVAWPLAPQSYAEYVKVHQDKCVIVPDGISHEVACASMLQGLTAHYLITSSYVVKPGDVALVNYIHIYIFFYKYIIIHNYI